ncbi:MAG: hypothetical protein ABSH26_16380 [Opitutaceae bacterium]
MEYHQSAPRSMKRQSNLGRAILFTFLGILASGNLAATPNYDQWFLRVVSHGDTDVTFALPEEFNVTVSASQAALASKFVPANQKMLSLFLTSNQYRYAMLESNNGLDNSPFTEASLQEAFAQYTTYLNDDTERRKLATEFTTTVNDRMSSDSAMSRFSMSIEKPLLMEVFNRTKSSFSFLALVGVNAVIKGEKKRLVTVDSTTIIGFKGKWLSLYLYEPYLGPDSYENIKRETAAIVAKTVQQNE